MPPWVFDGGYEALYKRLQDAETRKKIAAEMRRPTNEWETCLLPGSLDRILLIGFRSEKLKPLTGKTLAEVAKMRGGDPTDTVMDLILEDRSRVGTVYFLMSEENIKKQIAQPWVTFGSDAASMAAEGAFLKSSTHPRAYGCFARLLGKYVREEKVISLAGGRPPIVRAASGDARTGSARIVEAGIFCRRGGLRSERHRRQSYIRAAASIFSRSKTRFRQRRAGSQRWRTHRRKARRALYGPGKLK